MNATGHPKDVAILAATKLFTAASGELSAGLSSPPMNNFG